jgi:PPOX class probable F420-dependent enzyme
MPDTDALDEDAVRLAREGRSFACLTTLGPDGAPMTNPVWIDSDGQHLLVNTEVHRQKYRNVERDPRVTVLIVSEHNPVDYVEVRGVVADVVLGPEARAHIDAMTRKYVGMDDYPNDIRSERVILRITPNRLSHFTL